MTGFGVSLLGALVAGIPLAYLAQRLGWRGPSFWITLAIAAVVGSLTAGKLTGFVP